MSLPGIALPGRGTAHDPGAGGGRVPGPDGSPHYPNPGVVAPPHTQLQSSGLMGGLALCPRLFWKLGALSLKGKKG